MSDKVVKSDPLLQKKQAIEGSIHRINKDHSFLAALLNQVDITFDVTQKIAAICFDKKSGNYCIRLHPENFTGLTQDQQMAVLLHEIMHFTHGHMLRGNFGTDAQDHRMQNFAADIAINQFIKNLPEGCLYPSTFNLPENKTFEFYYEALKQQMEEQKQKQKDKGEGGGEGDQSMDGKDTMDDHTWEEGQNLTEGEKQQMAAAAKKILDRALEKTNRGIGDMSDSIKSLYQQIDGMLNRMNYRQILESCIKKSISHTNRKNTWSKPNRRFGMFAAGTKAGDMPKLAFFVDTSGSISHTELAQFFNIIDGFLKVGANRCQLGLWHTELYDFQKFKRGTDFNNLPLSSGGTDISDVMRKIDDEAFDLSIIITDGYYSIDPAHKIQNKNVLWIISDSKYNKMDHPYRTTVGKTIPMQGVLEDK